MRVHGKLRGKGTGKGRHTGQIADFTDLLTIVDKGLLKGRIHVRLARVITPEDQPSHWSTKEIGGNRHTFVEVETLPHREDLTVRCPSIGGVTVIPPDGAQVVILCPDGKTDFIPHLLTFGDIHERGDVGRTIVVADDLIELIAPAINLGQEATEEIVKGTTYRSDESTLMSALDTFLTALNVYIGAIQSIADPTSVATTALSTAITTMKTAITAFEGQASAHLSTVSKTK